MFDVSTLIEKQVLKRKCTLLKSLKISLESLMFERSSTTSWQFSFSSGNLTMFCRHILECVLDGAESAGSVWSLVSAVMTPATSSAHSEFKSVRDQMPSSSAPAADSYELILIEWIFYSLRHHCLLVQIECLLANTNHNSLNRYYNPNSFLLDAQLVHDFMLYIKAFERNNFGVLAKIHKTVFRLNQEIDECEAYLSKYGSLNFADADKNWSLGSSGTRTDSLTEASSPRSVSSSLTSTKTHIVVNQHRRMHSFPNIQINLAKKEAIKQVEEPKQNGPISKKPTGENIPTIALNDRQINLPLSDSDSMSTTTSSTKKEDIFSASNVFDLIHGVQINCEVSPLDKENSHFVIADLAIAAIELIKTSSVKPSRKYLSSASIRISNKPPRRPLHNSDSIVEFSLNSPPQSIISRRTIERTKSLSVVMIPNTGRPRRSKSLNDIGSVVGRVDDFRPAQSNGPSFLLFDNSIDSTSFSTDLSSYSSSPYAATSTLRNPTSRLLKFSSPTRPTDNVSRTTWSLNRSRTDPVFENGNDLDDNTLTPSSIHRMATISEKPTLMRLESQRSRRFSWEEIEDLFSAENIAKSLIRSCIAKCYPKRTNDHLPLLPTVLDFEFFIKYMEYYEFLQSYFESKNFARAKRAVVGSPEASKGGESKPPNHLSPSTAMSASSIYLSHSSASNATVLTNDNLSVSPSLADLASSADGFDRATGLASLFTRHKSAVPTLGSSSHKVKSAAYVLGNQTLMDQLDKQSSESATNQTGDVNSVDPQSSRMSLISGTGNNGARIIGDELWAPVREQLILNLHPKHKRAEQMQSQYFRCADCGIQIRYDKIKTFLYCEYFGKYFCRCCHISQQSYIPAYVVYLSDYRVSFEVSKKAKNFLEKIYNEPLITLESLNPNLFRDEASIFVRMKKLRTKLYNCRSYLNSCRFSAELKASLESQFDDFIINDQHVYSIQSLFRLRKSNYCEQFKSLVNKIIDHIKSCELCSQQGYICGFCQKQDLLYPFDFETVEKCPNCLACYHRVCFKSPENCPRCLRKKMRASKQSS